MNSFVRIVSCFVAGTLLVGCVDNETTLSVENDDGGSSSSIKVRVGQLPDVASLNTDRSDPDAVARDFMTIVESHDAVHEADEWSSVQRATELMTPRLAQNSLAYPEALARSDWPLWVKAEAVVEPVVIFTNDRRPPDTDVKAMRPVLAQFTIVSSNDSVRLLPKQRMHFLTLEKLEGQWTVTVWQAHQIEDNNTPQAGMQEEAS